jgi:hypothetical protein
MSFNIPIPQSSTIGVPSPTHKQSILNSNTYSTTNSKTSFDDFTNHQFDLELDIPWNEEHEQLFIEWADKALCYRWLHTKEHSRYSKANTMFTIPVIIMATIAGTANFAQDKVPLEYRDYMAMGIGSINITAGILTTIQQFLKISEYNEAHRVSSIAWDKFYRNIKIELSKHPNERIQVSQLLKHAKEEYDRLMETSPPISEKTIKLFKSTFSGGIENLNKNNLPQSLTIKQQTYLELNKPEICDVLESTSRTLYRNRYLQLNQQQTQSQLQLPSEPQQKNKEHPPFLFEPNIQEQNKNEIKNQIQPEKKREIHNSSLTSQSQPPSNRVKFMMKQFIKQTMDKKQTYDVLDGIIRNELFKTQQIPDLSTLLPLCLSLSLTPREIQKYLEEHITDYRIALFASSISVIPPIPNTTLPTNTNTNTNTNDVILTIQEEDELNTKPDDDGKNT